MNQPRFPLEREVALHFHSAFRDARATALRDAEDFDGIIFCLERLGRTLHSKGSSLAHFESAIRQLAAFSPLAEQIPAIWKECHTSFSVLYTLVRNGRNDAFHQGVVARQLTAHAVAISLILEDALMYGSDTIGDFMVRAPVCAYLWQPLSFLRQTMLENSFSYLPVWLEDDNRWAFISDHSIGRYVRGADVKSGEALMRPLREVIASGGIIPVPAAVYAIDTPVMQILDRADGYPVLVGREGTTELLGIVTAFDLL